ncbi:MAG: lipopolysaccharide biosynthesis protein [Lachnospiraceae bacterium]|nr:lipopolysaccharide biosynthesis protein [Lachnospiraceae bacterium]
MSKKRSTNFNTSMNIISGIGVLIVNVGISFLLSPYIIRTIGVEANGFVNLANNFVAYADILVTALNAMAARFITISYVNKDYKKANLYYNSVFWGNLIIVATLLIPATVFILKLDALVDVPSGIVTDVKVLFAIIFLSFFLRTGMPNWDCGPYISNRMDRSSFASIITSVLKCVILVCAFMLFAPHVWYVGFAMTFSGAVFLAMQWYNTHTLTPELKVSLKSPVCSFAVIKELVGSGIWSSFAIAGNTLMSGLDLLVCNKFLGATLMGVLAISKSIPNILNTFTESIRGAFGPELTIAYASGDKNGLLNAIERSLKISAVISTIPTAGIIIMSGDMYKLWIPSQDAHLLQILTALAVLRYVFSSGITNLNTVFVTVNKVKYNTVALVITGLVSIGTTVLMILFTDLDLYAVAGVSSIVMIIKDLCFMVPVTSHFLGYKWYQFYPSVFTSVISCVVICGVGAIVRWIIPVNSWIIFFLDVIIVAVIGLMVNMQIALNKSERAYLIGIFKRKILKK